MKILVIDDDSLMVELIKDILSENGHTDVDSASNGEEGIRAMNNESYDLIFVDYKMPKCSGITFLTCTKPHRADSKTVLVTSEHYIESLKNKEFYQIDYFLAKPFKISDIENILKDRRVK